MKLKYVSPLSVGDSECMHRMRFGGVCSLIYIDYAYVKLKLRVVSTCWW